MRGGKETNTHEAFVARKEKQEKKGAVAAEAEAEAAAAAAAQQQQKAADDEAAAVAAQAAAAVEAAAQAAAATLELERAAAVAATGADDEEEAMADDEIAAVDDDDEEEEAATKLEAKTKSILAMGRVPKRRAEVAVEHKRRVVEVTQVEEPTPRRRTATTSSEKGVKKIAENKKQLRKEEARGQRTVTAVRRELQYGGQ